MLISLHKQATTTPKIRAAIQASTEPAWKVAERYGISGQTVWKWRKRDGVHDRSHTAHRLQSTLTPAQEAVAVALRKTLLLPLDDLLSVVREFLNPNVSRSGLDRCLRRHGVGNLRAVRPVAPRPAHRPFKAEPGYLHVDVKYLPQMADEDRRRYLFAAIDRATRWVFVRIYPAKTAANARRFLRDLERAAPMRIGRVLTDNVLCSERLADLGVRSCSRWSIPARHQSAAGRALGQRAVSPITNTEYAHGGSHRPQDEILSQPSGRPEHYLRDHRRSGRCLHGLMREGSFRRASSPRRRDDRVGRL